MDNYTSPKEREYQYKRYLCCIKYCISICKFLKNIFGGQTGDKISHTKIKKNNKTTSQKPC